MTARRPVREYRFWSPVLGDHACRLSMPDERGGEYWMVVARPSHGREWRDARRAAVEALEAAADEGLEPGEIVIGDATGYPRSPYEEQFRRDAADEQARQPTRGEAPLAYKPAPGTPGPARSAAGGRD
jgi:hypothetical protein